MLIRAVEPAVVDHEAEAYARDSSQRVLQDPDELTVQGFFGTGDR